MWGKQKEMKNPHRPHKNKGKTRNAEQEGETKIMIKVLFVCHGSILKYSGKACKINVSTVQSGAYYTTITPFFERALK